MISIFHIICHIILHIFECSMILVCIASLTKLIGDYESLKGWVEWTFKMDLNKLAERIEEWKKEEGII